MIRIEPAARPLWRTTDSVQFGTDPVLALLEAVPQGAEHVIAALVDGTEPGLLGDLADRVGLGRPELAELMAALGPALRTPRPLPRELRVQVDGPPDLAAPVLRSLRLEQATGVPDLAIVVAHHLVPPADTVRWLALDVPHLPVVFGDQAVVVGPLVVPRTTACLRCADEHRLEDPAWRAVAAQLLRRRTSIAASSVPASLAACVRIADVLVDLREGRPTGLEGAADRLAADGGVSRVPRPWHDRCSCRWPTRAAPAPGGTGRVAAPPGGAAPNAPTTGAAGPALS